MTSTKKNLIDEKNHIIDEKLLFSLTGTSMARYAEPTENGPFAEPYAETGLWREANARKSNIGYCGPIAGEYFLFGGLLIPVRARRFGNEKHP